MLWYIVLLLMVSIDFGLEWFLNKKNILQGKSKWCAVLRFITKYKLLSIISITLLATFKAYSVGLDTYEYINYYNLTKNNPARLFKNPITNKFEFSFTFLNSLLVVTHANFRWLMFVVSVFVTISLVVFVNKVSVNKFMSFILFIALGFLAQTLNMYRQIIAIAFVLFAIIKLVDKKWIAPIFLILLGATFHISALLALAIIPLRFIKPKLWFVCVCFGVVIVAAFAMPQLLKLLEKFTPLDYYTKYYVVLNHFLKSSDLLNTLYSVALITLFGVLYCVKNKLKLDAKDKEIYDFYLLIFMVVPLFRIVGFIANMPQLLNRLSMYFFVVLIVLIPLFVKGLKHNKKLFIVANVMVYVVAIAYMVYLYAIKNTCGVCPYIFCF